MRLPLPTGPARMAHRTVAYDIDYLGADGRKRGQESCVLTHHGDDCRTLRAKSEIFDAEVLRDVVYTVNAAFQPLDALIRVSVRDRLAGSAWFRFDDGMAECEGWSATEGRISQRLALPGRAASFLTHAVAADVWHGAAIRRDADLPAQAIAPLLSSSPLHNGASGPLLGEWPLRARYLGREWVNTPAGRFEAERIVYEEPTGEQFLDTWCTADGDRIMLRMHYPPYRSTYVLTSLREEAGHSNL